MKTLIQIFLLIFLPSAAFAAQSIDQFIPAGWEKIAQASGDLNKDGKIDIAFIVQNTDRKNIVKHDSPSGEMLNLNPRHLIILFNNGQDYRQVAINKNIPRKNDPVSACLVDPLEDGDLDIAKGKLIINLVYWMSCGGWSKTTQSYQFRWQNQQLELIGFDTDEFNRASGEQTQQSFNFLTSKRKITMGLNMIEEALAQPKIVWKKMDKKP